jgi:hypothetical protein
MEQRYYAKNSAGYYREGFLAHGSMSSKVFYTTWHWAPTMSVFAVKRDIALKMCAKKVRLVDGEEK